MLELVSIRLLHKPTMLLSDYACCQLTFVVKPFFHCAFVYLKQIVKICCLSLYEVATRFSTQSLPQITCEQIWSTIIKQVYFCFGSCHFCIDINRISWHYCINADKPRKQSFSLSSLYSICIATHCTCTSEHLTLFTSCDKDIPAIESLYWFERRDCWSASAGDSCFPSAL